MKTHHPTPNPDRPGATAQPASAFPKAAASDRAHPLHSLPAMDQRPKVNRSGATQRRRAHPPKF